MVALEIAYYFTWHHNPEDHAVSVSNYFNKRLARLSRAACKRTLLVKLGTRAIVLFTRLSSRNKRAKVSVNAIENSNKICSLYPTSAYGLCGLGDDYAVTADPVIFLFIETDLRWWIGTVKKSLFLSKHFAVKACRGADV